MDKSKQKPKKKKIVQITYPAPYTQPWIPEVKPALLKNKVNKVGGSASLPRRCNRPCGCTVSARAWSQQFPARQPDPTAPHLKYGVFRNRRGAPPKPFPPIIDTCPKMDRCCKRLPSPARQIKSKPGQVKSSRGLTRSSSVSVSVKPVGKAISELPKFGPGTLSKELCFSKVSHLDIKPKTGFVSPSFYPTPRFKTMPPRPTLTPTKFRHIDSVEVP